MDKQKIDFSKYHDMHSEHQVTGDDGTTVTVRDHIPYAEKEAMATELATRLVMIHNDSCCYEGYEFRKIECFLNAKFYTDIDIEDATEEDVADFLINNGLDRKIEEINGYDIRVVYGIMDRMMDAVSQIYEDDHSIKTALRTSFGFLFNGEDVTESLAKAETVSGTLFDALSALKNQQKRQENGTVNVGGAILNFARKEE